MYASFYNLKDDPFRLSPDPYYCYKHRSYVQAEGYLRYGVERAEGIVMITGVPGTGKTTLISDLLKDFTPSRVLIGTLVVTRLDTDNLFRAVAYALDLSVEGMDRASVLRTLELFLTERAEKGKRALLVVDEAQNLTLDGLEDLRLLTNLQMGNRPLLQIFLLGQVSLRQKVQDSALAQLQQRIIAACHLEPLEADETRAYIEQRLDLAGWNGDPGIMDEAFEMLHSFSGGIPRRINQLCSRLFLYGSVDRKHVLDVEDVQTVYDDFRDELLLPAAEWPDSEVATAAYQRAGSSVSYKPRIVTPSGRPVSARVDGPTRNPVRTPDNAPKRAGDKPQRVDPRLELPPDTRGAPASPEAPEPNAETSRPRLQPVVSKVSINEALKSLADDEEPTLPAARPRAERAAPRVAPKSKATEPEARPAENRPSLYADARGQPRPRGPSPLREHYGSGNDERYSRGHGRSWLTLLLAVALLLTSVYLANPLIRDRYGIDVVAVVQEKLNALTGGASAPAAQAPAQASDEPVAEEPAAVDENSSAADSDDGQEPAQ